jgi:hypothetical protein
VLQHTKTAITALLLSEVTRTSYPGTLSGYSA